jgi:hypothetical protein
VERNKALRALVRYAIRRDGAQPGVEVRDPAPSVAGEKKPDGAEKLSVEAGGSPRVPEGQ